MSVDSSNLDSFSTESFSATNQLKFKRYDKFSPCFTLGFVLFSIQEVLSLCAKFQDLQSSYEDSSFFIMNMDKLTDYLTENKISYDPKLTFKQNFHKPEEEFEELNFTPYQQAQNKKNETLQQETGFEVLD